MVRRGDESRCCGWNLQWSGKDIDRCGVNASFEVVCCYTIVQTLSALSGLQQVVYRLTLQEQGLDGASFQSRSR